MAVKYTLSVNSQKNQDWLVEIDFPDYSGDVIELVGDRNPILIEWSGGTNDNPFDNHIISQSATFKVYDDKLDIEELQAIGDGDVVCRIYADGQLKHQGFVISDGIMDYDSGVSSLVTIKSIDGLSFLDNIRFVWSDDYGTITAYGQEGSRKCPMNTIRKILYDTGILDNVLPIRFSDNFTSQAFPEDHLLAGRNEINSLELFPVRYPEVPEWADPYKILEYTPLMSCRWWLENILKTSHSWLYQRDGYWYISNYEYLIQNSGVFRGLEITSSTEDQVATFCMEDFSTSDLSLEFINHDAYWMVKKPLSGVDVVYEATTAGNNVLVNGGGDVYYRDINPWTGTPDNFPKYWYSGDEDLMITTVQPINGDNKGFAVNADNISVSSKDTYISFDSEYLDTNVLFKKSRLGLKWMPMAGYEVDGDGFIDFSKYPIHISVKLTLNLDGTVEDYYLNEFGYWSNNNIDANVSITDVSIVNSPTNTQVRYTFFNDFYQGDVVDLSISYILHTPGFPSRKIETHYVFDTDTSKSLIDGVSDISDLIPGSETSTLGDVLIVNIPLNTTNVVANGITYKSGDYYKKIEIDGGEKMKVGDVLDIQFQSKGYSGDIKLPSYMGSGAGVLSFQIFSKGGTYMRLDDVYFRVEDNNDKYEIRIPERKATVEEYSVGVSSGFSTHILSNYSSYLFRRIGREEYSTLTQLYGEFILDWRNQPKKIFEGSIDRIVQAGDFLDIKGRKYIVMNSSVDGDGVSKITAFEASLNPLEYAVEHKGTIQNNN